MHGQPLEDGGEENGQSSPIVLAEEEEMEGIGDKVKVAILENCQQWEKGENGKEEEDVYFTQQEIHWGEMQRRGNQRFDIGNWKESRENLKKSVLK